MDTPDVRLDTGTLSPEQVRLLLGTLPLDLTFVDELGAVRFYSEGYRIFSRTPDVIGRDIVECHSPETRERVSQLMSEFVSGWRDSAEFMAEEDGRLVSVRYLGVRDADGAYRGVLEVAQYVDEIAPGGQAPTEKTA